MTEATFCVCMPLAVQQKLTQNNEGTQHFKCPGLMVGKFGGFWLCSRISILISALEEFQGVQLLETGGMPYGETLMLSARPGAISGTFRTCPFLLPSQNTSKDLLRQLAQN